MDSFNVCWVTKYMFTVLLHFCWLPVALYFCNRQYFLFAIIIAVRLLEANERDYWGDRPYREHNSGFLAGLLRWSFCQAWPLATTFSVPHTTFFCRDFLNRTCTSITQEAWKTLNNTQQAVAGADQQILAKTCKSHCETGDCLPSGRFETFATSAVIALFSLFFLLFVTFFHLWKNENKINCIEYWVAFYTGQLLCA